MRTNERYKGVLEWFQRNMPSAESELHYRNPYELLVAVILSAQCTDKRVNLTTPALFERFPTPESMAAAEPEEIYNYIKSISYPNNKAKNLSGMARMLVSEFGGVVPSDIDQLQRLPGVGRKTANVMGVVLFDKAVMPVDTHVFRVSANRTATDRTHPGQTATYCPSLADSARTLCLHGTEAEMQKLRTDNMVPLFFPHTNHTLRV